MGLVLFANEPSIIEGLVILNTCLLAIILFCILILAQSFQMICNHASDICRRARCVFKNMQEKTRHAQQQDCEDQDGCGSGCDERDRPCANTDKETSSWMNEDGSSSSPDSEEEEECENKPGTLDSETEE